jgi:hypothetical protein
MIKCQNAKGCHHTWDCMNNKRCLNAPTVKEPPTGLSARAGSRKLKVTLQGSPRREIIAGIRVKGDGYEIRTPDECESTKDIPLRHGDTIHFENNTVRGEGRDSTTENT